MKGSSEKMELFTCDVDPSVLLVEKLDKFPINKQDKKIKRLIARVEKNRLRT
jgi:hypothetical protein